MPQVPDVKAEVMNRLRAVLPCPVVSKRPEGANTPPEFVRVIATGGAGRLHVATAHVQLTIVWSDDRPGHETRSGRGRRDEHAP